MQAPTLLVVQPQTWKLVQVSEKGIRQYLTKSPYALTFQPTQPFLGIYLEGIQTIQKNMCTRLFTAAFFVTTKY